MYDRGMVTRMELVIRLAQAAVDHPPETFAHDIPADLLAELRGLCANPPDPETVCITGFGMFPRGYDRTAHYREQSRHYVEGLRRWRTYFADHTAAPPGLGG
jgi:hypothetical protein